MLILLDIDGVLVNGAPHKPIEVLEDGFAAFMPKAVEHLNYILNETGTDIVLTTSHKGAYPIRAWKEIFKRRGVQIRDIKKLRTNSLRMSRASEILTWSENQPRNAFVIIDDDQSLHSLPRDLKSRCIITSPYVGLTKAQSIEAIKILSDTA